MNAAISNGFAEEPPAPLALEPAAPLRGPALAASAASSSRETASIFSGISSRRLKRYGRSSVESPLAATVPYALQMRAALKFVWSMLHLGVAELVGERLENVFDDLFRVLVVGQVD
jgi:hypothetical protein